MAIVQHIIHTPHPLEVTMDRLPLTFHTSAPAALSSETIPVVVLHGFGEHSTSKYMQSLHETLSQKYNLFIITVNYVGTFTKHHFEEHEKPFDFIQQSIVFREEDKKVLIDNLEKIFENPDPLTHYLKQENYLTPEANLGSHKRHIKYSYKKFVNNELTYKEILDVFYLMNFKQMLAPVYCNYNKDHQDFGLIQAVDILTAIAYLNQQPEYQSINWHKLSIAGSSHGGYIASMCRKIAPNTFSKVVDNAGWTEAQQTQMLSQYPTTGLHGFEDDRMFYSVYENNIWSTESDSVNYFMKRHEEIRNLNNTLHLNEEIAQLNENNKHLTQIYYTHTVYDQLVPIAKKDDLIDAMNEIGFKCHYNRLTNETDLDGKTFKHLDHGAGASLKGLVIDYIYNSPVNEMTINDFDLKSKIRYTCDSGYYLIDYSNVYPVISFHRNT